MSEKLWNSTRWAAVAGVLVVAGLVYANIAESPTPSVAESTTNPAGTGPSITVYKTPT